MMDSQPGAREVETGGDTVISPILLIPRELRDMIYELSRETKKISKKNARISMDLERMSNPAILRVCKQINEEYRESTPIKKSKLHINLDHKTSSYSMNRLLLKKSFDPADLRAVRECTINLNWLQLVPILRTGFYSWTAEVQTATGAALQSLQTQSSTPTKVLRDRLWNLLGELWHYLFPAAQVTIHILLDGYDPTTEAESPPGLYPEGCAFFRKIFNPATMTEMMNFENRIWPAPDKLRIKFFTRVPLYYSKPAESWRSRYMAMRETGREIEIEAEPSSTMVE